MKPEEFTAALRDRVHKELGHHVEMVRDGLTHRERRTIVDRMIGRPGSGRIVVDQAKLARFLRNPGQFIARHEKVDPGDIPRINALVMAIYESRALNEYVRGVSQKLEGDDELTRAFETILEDPNRLSVEHARMVFGRLLSNDTHLTGPIRVLLEDDKVRDAMELPPDFSFDEYIQGVRQAIQDANTVEEVLSAAKIGPGLMACSWVGVCVVWVLLAVVQTVVAAQAYAAVWAVETLAVFHFVKVSTVTTVAGVAQGVDLLPPDTPAQPALESDCRNDTEQAVWVVIRFPGGLKRLPLRPGESTAGLGLPRAEAVIIGGKGNPVQSLATPSDGRRERGAYVLEQRVQDPAVVVVRPGADGPVIEANETQRAGELAGSAGWLDEDRCPYSMSEVAAAYPDGLDREALADAALDAAHFYKTLRLNALALGLKRAADA